MLYFGLCSLVISLRLSKSMGIQTHNSVSQHQPSRSLRLILVLPKEEMLSTYLQVSTWPDITLSPSTSKSIYSSLELIQLTGAVKPMTYTPSRSRLITNKQQSSRWNVRIEEYFYNFGLPFPCNSQIKTALAV